jgi:hypothetical protein
MTKVSTKKPATKAPAKAKTAKPKIDPDVIITSKAANPKNTEHHMVTSAGGESLTFPTERWVGKTRELSAVGGSFKALKAHWDKLQVAKLAKGLNGRDAPHSSKAVADGRAKAPAKPAKPAKAAAQAKKAERAEAKAKAQKADRPYKALVKFADTGVRPGTWTTFMVETILAHKSTDAAMKASEARRNREFGGKKLDFKWAADVKKFIQFTD